jgi:hypothetical protein
MILIIMLYHSTAKKKRWKITDFDTGWKLKALTQEETDTTKWGFLPILAAVTHGPACSHDTAILLIP